MNEHRFTVFLQQLQNDFKGFIWCCALFMLFRILFIGVFSSQLVQGLFTGDTAEALWLGLRLSLKTAGFAMLFSTVGCTIPRLFFRIWNSDTLRYYWFAFLTFLFSILFFARIPYYKIFNSGYNLMLINGKHDDIRAILITAVQEYGLLWRLPLAILTALGLCFLLKKWLRTGTHRFTVSGTKDTLAKSVLVLAGIVVFWVFVRYGGTVFSKNTINWENASRFRSNLLNEAVLDDGQALYRVYSIYRRMKKNTEVTFTAEELRKKIAAAGGNSQADTVDAAFLRTVTEEKLKTQPRHIVLVLGESYAQWPFLPQFDKPGTYLVEKGRKLAASPQAIQTHYMLAHGTGTMPAVNGFLSGLPDTGIYLNYEKESFKEPYAMGIGSVLKQLGYKTIFWYGGFGSWQGVEPFARAQCFDEFRDASSFAGYKGGNTWGAPDKELFTNVSNYITQHKGEKIFHLILTTSNHPPYSVNLKEAGFDSAKAKAQLPETIAGDKNTINELGHIWYADHSMGEFVETVERGVPESLFVITGDHAERFSFAKEMDLQSLCSIPCIFYGKGINSVWMPQNQFGSALQIAPTIAVLAGRKGDTYNSMVQDLLQKQDFVFNHHLWADKSGMYVQDTEEQGTKIQKNPLSEANRNRIVILRQIAAWRILKGNQIK
jgi:phosphoglycerol transferase MdoB-like AlkP superfamily enzyme